MYFLPSSNLGNNVLIYKNYKFWINNRLKNSLSWACSHKKKFCCQCRVITTRDGLFLSVHGAHNHPPRWCGYNKEDDSINIEFNEYMKVYNNYKVP